MADTAHDEWEQVGTWHGVPVFIRRSNRAINLFFGESCGWWIISFWMGAKWLDGAEPIGLYDKKDPNGEEPIGLYDEKDPNRPPFQKADDLILEHFLTQ